MRKFPVFAVTLACLSAVIAGTAVPRWPSRPSRQRRQLSAPERELSAVSCTSSKNCVGVGFDSNGDPVLETWDGAKWTYVPPKLPAKSTGGELSAVSCVSVMTCLAIGGADLAADTVPLAESGSGKTWTLRSPQASVGSLGGLSCTTAGCVVVGQNQAGAPLADTWSGGSKWAETKLPEISGSSDFIISGISCVHPKGCVADGAMFIKGVASYPVEETWNGAKWTVARLPQPKGAQFGSAGPIDCFSLTKCFAFGSSNTPTDKRITWVDVLAGSKWTPVTLVDSVYAPGPDGLSCGSAKSCLAVGTSDVGGNLVDSGKSYAWSWNGTTWEGAHGAHAAARRRERQR